MFKSELAKNAGMVSIVISEDFWPRSLIKSESESETYWSYVEDYARILEDEIGQKDQK